DIDEVVVARKNQLCCSDINVDDTESGELAEDLLSIVTIFIVRHNGLRLAQNRKRRRETKNSKNTNVPNIRRKRKWIGL
ncbi:28010_t:CDS:2, partial [Racocetra persica]